MTDRDTCDRCGRLWDVARLWKLKGMTLCSYCRTEEDEGGNEDE